MTDHEYGQKDSDPQNSAGEPVDQNSNKSAVPARSASSVGGTIWVLSFIAVAVVYLWPSNKFSDADGVILLGEGKYDKAIASFDASIRKLPDSYAAYSYRGSAYRQKGDYDRALSDLDKSISLSAEKEQPYYERALTWEAVGDTTRALADYADAIKLKPNFGHAYYRRALIFRRQNKPELAMADLNKALDAQQTATWYEARATLKFFELKRPLEAADDFAEAASQAIKYRDAKELLSDPKATQPSTPMMDSKVPFIPGGFYLFLRAHYSRVNAGQDDRVELSERVAIAAAPTLKRLSAQSPEHFRKLLAQKAGFGTIESYAQAQAFSVWPGPAYLMFVGTVSPEAVRAAAQSVSDDLVRKRRQCDADFYIGVFKLQKRLDAEAQILFQSAAESCPQDGLEGQFAKVRLKK